MPFYKKKRSSSSSLSKNVSPITHKHSKYRPRHEHLVKHHDASYKKRHYLSHNHSPDTQHSSSDFSENIHSFHKSKNKSRYYQQRASPSYEPYQNPTLLRCNQDTHKSSKRGDTLSRSPHRYHKRQLKTSSPHKSSKHKKERLLRPETSILAMIIKDQVRTNDRMDREEVKRATLALRELDPTTTDQARLMTEYLASACSKRV